MVDTARDVALRYVDLVNDGRLADIVDMYADDGEVHPPNPAYAPVIRGRDALRQHYQRSVGTRLPKITVTHLYVDGRTAVVELESKTVDEADSWGIVDIFTVNEEGKITRLAAYRRQLSRPGGTETA